MLPKTLSFPKVPRQLPPTFTGNFGLRAEIEAREGVNISRSQLSKALRKKNFRWRRPRHTLKGRQIAAEIERVGLRLRLRKAQAEAGDIVLLRELVSRLSITEIIASMM